MPLYDTPFDMDFSVMPIFGGMFLNLSFRLGTPLPHSNDNASVVSQTPIFDEDRNKFNTAQYM